MRGTPYLLLCAALLLSLSVSCRCEDTIEGALILRTTALDCIKSGDMAGAAKAIVEISQKYPSDAGSQLVLEFRNKAQGEKKAPMLASLTSALSGKPNALSARCLLAQLYGELGKNIEANIIVSDVLPKIDGKLILIKAVAQIGLSDAMSIEVYKLRVKAEPDNSENVMALANAYMNSGKNEPAIEIAREIMNRSPGNAPSLSAAAQVFMRCKLWDDAAKALLAAIELKPSDVDSYRQTLGYAYQGAGRDNEAVAVFESLIATADSPGRLERVLRSLSKMYEPQGEADKLASAMVRVEEKCTSVQDAIGIELVVVQYSQRENRDAWNRKLLPSLEKALQDRPKLVGCRLVLCEMYGRCGETAKASELFATIVTEQEMSAGVLRSIADRLRESKSLLLVLALEQLVKLEPDELDNWSRLATAQLAVGQKDGALATVRRMQDKWADQPKVAMSAAGLLEQLGLYEEAAGIYKGLVKKRPGLAKQALGSAASAYEKAGKLEESISLLTANMSPQMPTTERVSALMRILRLEVKTDNYTRLAQTITQIDALGGFKESDDAWRFAWIASDAKAGSALADALLAAVADKPELVRSRFILLELLMKSDRDSEVEGVAMQMVASSAASANDLKFLNMFCERSSSRQKCSEAIYKRLAVLEPDQPASVLCLMGIYMIDKRKSEAIECGKTLLKKWPKDVGIMYATARSFGELGEVSEAAEAYSLALAMDPSATIETKYDVAVMCERAGRRDTAFTLYREVAAKATDDSRRSGSFRGIARMYLLSAEFDAVAKTLLESETGLRDAQFSYRSIYSGDDTGMKDERVAAALERALKGKTGYPLTLRLLADICVKLDKPTDALAIIDRARKMAKGDTNVLRSLAYVCQRHSALYQTGISICKEAVASDPNNGLVIMTLADLHDISGAKKEAAEAALSVLGITGVDFSTLANIGHMLTRLERWDDAIKAYQKAIDEALKSERLSNRQDAADIWRCDIARVYAKAGRKAEAEATAKEVLARTENVNIKDECERLLSELGK